MKLIAESVVPSDSCCIDIILYSVALIQESCRFVDNALQVINSIGKCINSFTDTEAFKRSWDELVSHHCPYRHDKLMSKQHHFEVSCLPSTQTVCAVRASENVGKL